eukprot:GEMP01120446.1.p2 GENE.GEMP01120446.1~~GEMP01120446.1.p2  ORF type:complete len:111 (-),score=17.20 GEMP01120446.1:93-425(-)
MKIYTKKQLKKVVASPYLYRPVFSRRRMRRMTLHRGQPLFAGFGMRAAGARLTHQRPGKIGGHSEISGRNGSFTGTMGVAMLMRVMKPLVTIGRVRCGSESERSIDVEND